MSNQQDSPWASGAGFGTPHQGPQQPDPALDAPTLELNQQPVTPNYTNPTVYAPTAQFAAAPAAEPNGWSEPQQFGGLDRFAAAPVQFAGRVPYGYGAPMLPEHPNSNLVLTLGIVGVCANFFLLPFISPIAWYLGAKARRDLANHPGVYRDSGKLTAGFALGIVGSLFTVAVILLIVGLIASFTL